MPCVSNGPTFEEIARAKRMDDAQCRLACDYCKLLESQKKPIPGWAREWWSYHKERDRERENQLRRDAKEKKERRAALAKLSKAERKVLGL